MLSKLTRMGLIVIVISLLLGNPAVGINARPVSGIGSISAGPAQNAPGTPNPTYKFVVDSIDVVTTRSFHEDTDYIGFGVSVKNVIFNGAPQVEKIGDLNNGHYPINLEIGPVPIPNDPNYPVSVAYIIANIGGSFTNTVENFMVSGTEALINSFVPVPGPAPYEAAMNFAAKYLEGIFGNFPDICDGVVAADKIVTNGQQIAQWTANGPYNYNQEYIGSDSPIGCSGSDSAYVVHWHVERVS